MKKTVSLIIIFFLSQSLFAAGGIFDSFAIVNANNSGNNFYDLSANTGNTDFLGANLGSFNLANNSIKLGGQLKSYKNSGTDVTGASIFYRIYPSGSPSGLFTLISYSFQIENVGGTLGDQQWGTDINGANASDKGVEVLAGTSLSIGTYVLEVYAAITTNGVNADPLIFDNNSGVYYQATFTVDEALPVELTSFVAFTNDENVTLNWQTATEVNNYGFEIERQNVTHPSVDGSNNLSNSWEKIRFIEGYGNSNSPKSYSYSDKTINSGKFQYRLKQIDIDGSFEYSDVVEVNVDVPNKLELSQNYPNPFNPTTSIKFSLNEETNVTLTVFNIIGENVAELINQKMEAGFHTAEFDASDLNSGIYIYRLQTEKNTFTKKMTVLK